jgi:hypothetical protein
MIMRKMKRRIIKGSGGVTRESSFIIAGRNEKCTAGCDGKCRVELWGMKKGQSSKVAVCRQGDILD